MVNLCRVVYVIDEPRRYGFAYGTLEPHAVAGEQRFLVEWRDDNSVWYEVLHFSHEKHPLAKIAYPVARRIQEKFRRDSGIAMQGASAVVDTTSLRTLRVSAAGASLSEGTIRAIRLPTAERHIYALRGLSD